MLPLLALKASLKDNDEIIPAVEKKFPGLETNTTPLCH